MREIARAPADIRICYEVAGPDEGPATSADGPGVPADLVAPALIDGLEGYDLPPAVCDRVVALACAVSARGPGW